MAANWNMPIWTGPPVYLAQNSPKKTNQTGKANEGGQVFSIPDTPEVNTLDKFQESIKEFQEALKELPPQHKAEVRTIHQAVEVWANKEHAAGRKADKLATFTGRVMEYCNAALESIERSDPDLVRRKEEHNQLNTVFYKGAALVDAYHAYVKDKSQP